MYLQRRYEVDEVQNTTMQRLPGDGKGPFSGHHPVVPAGPPTQGVSTFNAPTDVSSADAAEQAARKKSSAEALPVDGSVLGIEAVRKVANGASHAASKSAQLPPDAASIDAVGKKLQQHAEPANASVHLHRYAAAPVNMDKNRLTECWYRSTATVPNTIPRVLGQFDPSHTRSHTPKMGEVREYFEVLGYQQFSVHCHLHVI
jgi:hypothetical protein